MKILLVSPHIDAQHNVVRLLKAKGVAVLLPTMSASTGPTYFDEAWQIIETHGASLDLIVLHREDTGGKDSGIELIFKIKKDPVQQDLPILLTTESWSEEECANHQQTPMGANAYLKWPTEDSKLIETIDAILPPEEPRTSSEIQLEGLGASSIVAPAQPGGEFVLEDPSAIFSKTNPKVDFSKLSVQLESSQPIEFTTPRINALSATPPTAPADATNIPVLSEPDGSISIQMSTAISLTSDTSASTASPTSQTSTIAADQNLTGMSGLSLSLEPSSEVAGGLSLDLSADTAAVGQAPSLDLSAVNTATIAQTQALESSPNTAAISQPQSLGGAVIAAPGQPPKETSQEVPEGEVGSLVESQMPYLFSKGKTGQTQVNPAVVSTFAHPLGDAIIPGGAVSSPDIETLKKYLLLREQDVAALSVQLKNAKDESTSLNRLLLTENSRVEELEMIVNEQKRKIDDFEKEKAIALETLNSEIAEIRFQGKTKNDKVKLLEIQVQEAATEIDRLKERVRSDIRKIRVRERELENKLEITKKDAEVVMAARENKIIELKRKIDLLEFNMDLLQDRYSREKDAGSKLREKLAKAAQVVRVAEGLLDDPLAASLKQTVETLTANSGATLTSRGDKAS